MTSPTITRRAPIYADPYATWYGMPLLRYGYGTPLLLRVQHPYYGWGPYQARERWLVNQSSGGTEEAKPARDSRAGFFRHCPVAPDVSDS